MTVTSRPRRMGLAATAFGLAIAVGTPLFTTSASATATQFDPAKVSALTLQIENAIARLGPNATEAEESAAIQAPPPGSETGSCSGRTMAASAGGQPSARRPMPSVLAAPIIAPSDSEGTFIRPLRLAP